MKAYIQRINGEIPDDWVFAAKLGLKNKGIEIAYFTEENIENIPCRPDVMVVGYIEPTVKYFKLNGIQVPPPLNIPAELLEAMYLYRTIDVFTMKELKEYSHVPMFVKPLTQVKQFDSGVITKHDTKRYVFKDVPDDALVQTSTVVDFISEWRCFVHNHELKGIQYYQGDFTVFPDSARIKQMVEEYTLCPVAYSLDVGVITDPDGKQVTVLVECNDMWSIGHYGLRDTIYSTLLRDRWLEIIKNK